MRRLTFAVLAFAMTAGHAATFAQPVPAPTSVPPPARPLPPPPGRPMPPPRPYNDARSWKLLAEAPIPANKTSARLMFPEPQNQPTLSAMVIVVTGGEFRMQNTNLMYRNRVTSSISVDQVFRDGDRKEIDLRASAGRPLWYFEFRYPAVSVKGYPRVQVWGIESSPTTTPTPQPVPQPIPQPVPQPQWDPRGWTMLGQKEVTGRADRDTIFIGRDDGAFTSLTLEAIGNDIELFDMLVTFGDGQTYAPNLRYTFREGQRTRSFDLPGGARVIKKVEFRYGNLPGNGRTKVQLWGKAGAAPPPPVDQWQGWTLLGEKSIDGRVDRDTINVGRGEGRFSKMVFVVEGGDVDIFNVTIKFGRGRPYDMALRQSFRAGTTSREIDLPGDRTVIKWIDLVYGTARGNGQARLRVYAR